MSRKDSEKEYTLSLMNLKGRDIKKLSKLTTGEITDEAWETLKEILSRVIISCPTEWGDPTNPDTYEELSFFGIIKPMLQDLGKEAKNLSEE